MDVDVGGRLRIVRTRHGLSQRSLARRAGIGNATISLIESNALNPSVGALKRILDCLPMGLSEFFAFEVAPSKKIFFRAKELTEIGQGGVSYRQVGQDLRDRSLQILHERYSPGADTGKVMLQHEGEEGGVIIRGRLEVTVGDSVMTLGPNEAYFFNSREPHRFRNAGSEPCEVVSSCTPPTF